MLMILVIACKKDNHFSIESGMILVKGGTFIMGCSNILCCENELPQHQVTLSSFKIAKNLVTQKQWEDIMGITVSQQRDKKNPDCPLHGEGDDYPIYYVSWNDAQEFITKLNAITGKNYRLPTEAEWEFAARGGNKSKGYKYSGSNNLNEVAWIWANCNDQCHPVGTKLPNELGIYDMSGNLSEWCSDWYDYYYYSYSPQNNPQGAEESSGKKVVRGGYSISTGLDFGRVVSRNSFDSTARKPFLGFRLVLPL